MKPCRSLASNDRKENQWWLIGFAVLHTVMFLVPQLFATSTVLEMGWGTGKAPEPATVHEIRLGGLGIAYTPMLLAMAYLTAGPTRAKMALITALSMGVVIVLDVGMCIQQAGYLDDMSLLFMIGFPAVIFGGMLALGSASFERRRSIVKLWKMAEESLRDANPVGPFLDFPRR